VVVLALVLGLGSSVAWGMGDFLGGLKSRQLPLLNVLVGSQLTGLLIVSIAVAARGEGPPGGDFAIFAALSGVAGAVGLASFYRGLAVGNMGIVAPISATSAVIPVVIGIATGDRPSTIEAAGLALAFVGVVLASRDEVGTGTGGSIARGAGLAVVSALGFGFFFVAIDRASDADVLWAILVNRCTSVSLLLAAAAVVRPPLAVRSQDVATLILIGTLDITANLLFAVAAREGLISLVAVVASLYPLTTVVLARLVLGERAHRAAQVGVAAALVGVALIALG
jgi:drug/metabolite transporter (DMT)-like permease